MGEGLTCPRCGAELELSDALRQAVRAEWEEETEARLQAQRQMLEAAAAESARRLVAEELRAAEVQRQILAGQVAEARVNELAARQERQRLAQEKEALALEVQRRLDAERTRIREQARAEVLDQEAMKLAERDLKILELAAQISDLKRRADQGSERLAGEALEWRLEELLKEQFPGDGLEPVPRGRCGGDLLHRVRAEGHDRGVILWEAKRTRAWQAAWLPKLRQDAREAKADAAVIVTATMPAGMQTFEHMDGVWVTAPAYAVPLGTALRAGLLELGRLRQAQTDRGEKLAQLYAYLTGPEFRGRIGGVVEALQAMQADLRDEQRAAQRAWAKREKHLSAGIGQLVSVRGDLQAIAGAAFASSMATLTTKA